MKNKIAIVGSCTFDITAAASHLPKKGESLIGSKLIKSPGGKGANQATTCQRLGIQTAMIGAMGEDEFSSIVREAHKKSGMNVRQLISVPGTSTGFASIFLDDDANNCIIVVPGANMSMKPSDVDAALDILQEVDIVMAQLEIPIETTLYALEKAKELGKTTILNPAPFQKGGDKIFPYADYITPNETELELFCGIEVKDENDALKGAKILQSRGAGTVIVTLGEKGALLVTKDFHKMIPSIRVSAVDTVAAGDCFNGGFASALIHGKDLETAVYAGTLSAALAVTKEGALSSLPYLLEVVDFCTSRGLSNPFQ